GEDVVVHRYVRELVAIAGRADAHGDGRLASERRRGLEAGPGDGHVRRAHRDVDVAALDVPHGDVIDPDVLRSGPTDLDRVLVRAGDVAERQVGDDHVRAVHEVE